jgi:hypothetical protein
MSWSGTVTCSYCYLQGHNKRKCPKLTEWTLSEYKKWADSVTRHISNGNPTQAEYHQGRAAHYRTLYIKRTKTDPATGEKVKNKTAKAERMKNVTCGYCSDSGHTRRICETVKRDKMVFIEESRRVRAGALADARETGIGVGSMIPIRSHGYNADNEWGTHTTLRYVKSVDWYTLTAARAGLWVYHVDARKLASANQNRWTSRDKILKMEENFKEACDYATLTRESQPTASLIPTLDPPAGWLECEASTIDVAAVFPTKGNKYEKQRKHDYAWPSGETAQVIRDLGLEEHWKGRF